MALTDKLIAIADAVREKAGTTEAMTLTQIAETIAGIETGGGGAKTAYGTLTLSEKISAADRSDATIVSHNLGVVPTGFLAIVENLSGTHIEYELHFMILSTALYYTEHWHLNTSKWIHTVNTDSVYLGLSTDINAEATTTQIRLTYPHGWRHSYYLPAARTIHWVVWG